MTLKLIEERKTPYNSTYPKGGVSCSKDSFVVNQTLVFQIKFCGKSPALRVAAKRQAVKKLYFFLKMSFLMPLSYSLKLIEPS
jgi:hypothetical protein